MRFFGQSVAKKSHNVHIHLPSEISIRTCECSQPPLRSKQALSNDLPLFPMNQSITQSSIEQHNLRTSLPQPESLVPHILERSDADAISLGLIQTLDDDVLRAKKFQDHY
jgi:hypothetical protein